MKCLTMSSSGEERHPVDGNRNGAMFIVEMVDVVRGAETRRHTCRPGLNGEYSEQGKPQEQSGAVHEAHAEAKARLSQHRGATQYWSHVDQIRMSPRSTR